MSPGDLIGELSHPPALCYQPRVVRPPVSVVVPFLGELAEAERLVAELRRLELGPGDQLILADNTRSGIAAGLGGGALEVVGAAATRSASFARNAGAAVARGEWLLFFDADCQPPRAILDAYLADPADERLGVIAGEVVGVAAQEAPLARWARSRRGAWVRHHLETGPHPGGVTANLLVRRAAFEQVGGFRVGGGGDLDLCWRLQDAGWGFAYRGDVVVAHLDRERPRELLSQAVAYGGHQRNLRREHGPAVDLVTLARPLARGLGGAIAHAAGGRGEEARFALVDAGWAAAEWWGWISGGRHARRAD